MAPAEWDRGSGNPGFREATMNRRARRAQDARDRKDNRRSQREVDRVAGAVLTRIAPYVEALTGKGVTATRRTLTLAMAMTGAMKEVEQQCTTEDPEGTARLIRETAELGVEKYCTYYGVKNPGYKAIATWSEDKKKVATLHLFFLSPAGEPVAPSDFEAIIWREHRAALRAGTEVVS